MLLIISCERNHNLLEQFVVSPVHSPLGWHVLSSDPKRVKPEAHANRFTLLNATPLPVIVPLVGEVRFVQLTTECAGNKIKTRNYALLVLADQGTCQY